jgi:hypothetical protein
MESPINATLGAEPGSSNDGENVGTEGVALGADAKGDGEWIGRLGSGSQRSTMPPRRT